MSGMYDLVFPDPDRPARTGLLIALLDEALINLGRFRDAWVEPGRNGKPVIVIYTRNGGGHRECDDDAPQFGCSACAMRAIVHHPQYLRDEDDGFDNTYARIWFRLPNWMDEAAREMLAEQMMLPVAVDTDERWQRGIEAVGKGPLTPEQQAFGERLANTLNEMIKKETP
jgi:hypothetical protein